MTKENKNLYQYQILILGCLLSCLLILNSNFVNKKRSISEINREKTKLFNKIILNRKLEGEEEPLEDSDKVCKRGSEELVEYYASGDLNKIGLDDKPIECKEKGKDYFDALINIIKQCVGNDDDDDDEGGSQESGSNSPPNSAPDDTENPPGGRRLNRKLDVSISDIQDDLITYAKHIIPIVAFLVIALLSIPGWLICCFCCCCNCCCCCCCKKPGCKIPCFLFTYIFYALSVAICIYGLSQTNKVFVGLSNTECSILKFFDQVLDGEKKTQLPRWAGITGINNILQGLIDEINAMKTGTKDTLEEQKDNITTYSGHFIDSMTDSVKEFRDADNDNAIKSTFLTTQSLTYTIDDYTINSQCVLDSISNFGSYEVIDGKIKFKPSTSTVGVWEFEYKNVSDFADSYIDKAIDGFDDILGDSSEPILKSLDSGIKNLEELKDSFDDIKSQIADPIIDYSDIIDDYGKLGAKLVFGVLALMNIALAAFVLLICFCSGKMCTNCCCCRCIFKLFTHLVWNVLSLLMIITFLVGFLFAFIGTIGYDVMNVISYVVSEENLGEDGEGILVGKLGESKKYLSTCVNGDGNLEKDLGLDMDQIESFDEINEAEASIDSAKRQFIEKLQFPTYEYFKKSMEDREKLAAIELSLVPKDEIYDPTKINQKYIPFIRVLTEMNTDIQYTGDDGHKEESWKTEDFEEDKVCGGNPDPQASYSGPIVFSPLKCNPLDRTWILNKGAGNSIYDRAYLLSTTIDQINTHANLYKTILNDIKEKYSDYLFSYINALDVFGATIRRITGELREYIGEGNNLFGFVNGKFIGTNLKIILKYLKSALGEDIKTIGICLLIVGCSLALSISSTILLIVVINADIDNNKQLQNSQIPEYKLNSVGRVIQYQ